MNFYQFTPAKSDDELCQIMALQKANLRHTQSPEIEQEQGFVTVVHDFEMLSDMNDVAPHIIAKHGDRVIGYALAMSRGFKSKIPELIPMFELLESIEVDEESIRFKDFLVMGQICVAEAYRGQGVFQGLYAKYFEIYKPKYKNIITEVAARNTRSLKAHMNVGFKEIYRYVEIGVEEWVVIIY